MLFSHLAAPSTGQGGFCLITGTTASGKSSLALALAARTGGVVVNADSVQLYRSLPLLTAQPTAADRERVEHRLYGLLDDDERCSVARWLELAAAAIRDVQPRLAIVTGGTGFYLEALLKGLAELPWTPPELRARSTERRHRLGPEGFAAELAARDPLLAAHGLPPDPQRQLRAWEVLELTGRSIVTHWATPKRRPDLPPGRGAVALVPEPQRTARRIERRVDAMLDAGALDELAAWLERPGARTSALFKADGVREFAAFLDGEQTLARARLATVIKVRRYAKRQRTWLRHRLNGVERVAAVGEDLAAGL